jgi:hypothetical protein
MDFLSPANAGQNPIKKCLIANFTQFTNSTKIAFLAQAKSVPKNADLAGIATQFRQKTR